ncbi:hypothetical protein [Nitrosomonas sp.]|uniref:hypothetical protein n=1 Tax=Nitrosomonas sp. TaxID=42353 RepID=UPI00261C6602|nr:hypothetical protein [Nitrosomonas sp.]
MKHCDRLNKSPSERIPEGLLFRKISYNQELFLFSRNFSTFIGFNRNHSWLFFGSFSRGGNCRLSKCFDEKRSNRSIFFINTPPFEAANPKIAIDAVFQDRLLNLTHS